MRLAETVADLLRGHAVVVDQLAKCLHLVGGVHVLAHDVFGQRKLGCVVIRSLHQQRHKIIERHLPRARAR